MGPALSILRLVPVWAYVLALALGWGAFQRHQAKQAAATLAAQQQQASQAREQALAATIQETERRLAAQKEVTDHANAEQGRIRADAGRALSERDRLRARLAALQADARRPHPPASAASAAGGLADLLGQCADRYSAVAGEADRAVVAGLACQQSYEALTQSVVK